MKKYFSMLLCLCLIGLLATSCAKKETTQNNNQMETQEGSAVNSRVGMDNVIPQETSAKEEAVDVDLADLNSMMVYNNLDKEKSPETPTGDESADVDLTILSSTMVYAEVYNMMTKPDDYIGKTIKMSGSYYASYYDETEQYYHFIVVEDTAACCLQGFELMWKGDHVYPDDYPEEQTKIEVIGVLGSYEELGETYFYLAVDDISILS